MNEVELKIKDWLDKLPVRIPNETKAINGVPKVLWALYEIYPQYELGECVGHSHLLYYNDISRIEHNERFADAKQYMIDNYANIDSIIDRMNQGIKEALAEYEDEDDD